MPKVVKSLRVEPELWSRVEAFASKTGLKVNGALERLLELGLLPTSIPLTKPDRPQTSDQIGLSAPKTTRSGQALLAKAEEKAAHLATKSARSKWTETHVPFANDIEHPYGRRLKGAKKK